MGHIDLLKKAFMEGYATSSITIGTVLMCIGCTMLIAIYIYFIYKMVNRNSFYNKGFNISLVIIAVITAAIILTIQSNIVVSLGMVGALSIVRFRTAIKDPQLRLGTAAFFVRKRKGFLLKKIKNKYLEIHCIHRLLP